MSSLLIHWVAGVAAIVVVAMVIFQILLVAGLPLGHGAFGGENQILSRKLRFLSAMTVVVFLAALYIILARGGILGRGNESSSLARVGIWVLALIFCVSTLANFSSHSRVERRLMAPIALLLTVCCVMVALA